MLRASDPFESVFEHIEHSVSLIEQINKILGHVTEHPEAVGRPDPANWFLPEFTGSVSPIADLQDVEEQLVLTHSIFP